MGHVSNYIMQVLLIYGCSCIAVAECGGDIWVEEYQIVVSHARYILYLVDQRSVSYYRCIGNGCPILMVSIILPQKKYLRVRDTSSRDMNLV